MRALIGDKFSHIIKIISIIYSYINYIVFYPLKLFFSSTSISNVCKNYLHGIVSGKTDEKIRFLFHFPFSRKFYYFYRKSFVVTKHLHFCFFTYKNRYLFVVNTQNDYIYFFNAVPFLVMFPTDEMLLHIGSSEYNLGLLEEKTSEGYRWYSVTHVNCAENGKSKKIDKEIWEYTDSTGSTSSSGSVLREIKRGGTVSSTPTDSCELVIFSHDYVPDSKCGKNYRYDKSVFDGFPYPEKLMEICDLVKRWSSSKYWYLIRGIRFRLGICLYGPPGTGKTTFIEKIAEFLNRPLYKVYLSTMTDANLKMWFDSSVQNSGERVVVFEDICKCFNGETSLINGLTYANFISVLDSEAFDNTLIFITSNEPNKLSNTLVHLDVSGNITTRPGRIDYAFEFSGYDYDCLLIMANRIFNGSEEDCGGSRALYSSSFIKDFVDMYVDNNRSSGITSASFKRDCIDYVLKDKKISLERGF